MVLAIGLYSLGGVLPWPRVALYGLIGLGCFGAALLPGAVLEQAGRVRALAVGFMVLLAAVAVGLVPLPHGLLRWVAPGTAAAFPEHGAWTLSLHFEPTLSRLAYLVLLLGMAVLAGTWGAVRWRRTAVEHAVVVFTLGLVAVTGVHVAAEVPTLFGLIQPELQTRRTFFAPFVNPNHFAAAALVGLPVCLGMMLRERFLSGWWLLSAVTSVGACSLLVMTRSRGGVVALVMVLGLAALRGASGRARDRLLMAGGAAGFLAVAGVVSQAGTGAVSLQSRMRMWGQALRAGGDAWLAGTGGGTFFLAIEPYRRDNEDLAWAHLHNDPLEWLVETGLVGGVALLLAAWLLFPRRSHSPDRGFWLSLGIGAVLLHSTVEFPLQMPGIALCVVTLLALRRTVFEERVPAPAYQIRALLIGVGLAQLVGMGWMARTAVADQAVKEIQAYRDDPDTARAAGQRLGRVAPWRGERTLLAGWEALALGDPERAADHARTLVSSHPHDGRLLRQAGLVLARTGRPDEAWAVLERAEARAPDDWRTAVAKARIAQEVEEDPFAWWRRAFQEGAPPHFIDEAFAVVPVGLVWLDALTERRSGPLVTLARTLTQQGDLQTARLAYEQAAAQDPERYAFHTGYIRVLLDLGEAGEAEGMIRRALEENPEDFRYHELLGAAFEAQGRVPDAVQAYLVASRSQPRVRAKAIRAAGAEGLEAAVRVSRQLELTGDLDARSLLELARVHRQAGDPHGCVQLIERHDLRGHGELGQQATRLYRQCGGR